MKSPLTGKAMPLLRQKQVVQFRKEEFEIYQHHYLCIDSGSHYSTEEFKELNLRQVHNKYREKHSLPFSDEIRHIRQSYRLSASKMAEILGFGINVYRHYESGEVPSISNARLIQMCRYPENFLRLVKFNKSLKDSELRKIEKRIKEMQDQYSRENHRLGKNLLSVSLPGIANGFVSPDQKQILSLIEKLTSKGPVELKWIALLIFIIDFINFRKTGRGISGLFYNIDNGMIFIDYLPGLVYWASGQNCCNFSVNTRGQAMLFPSRNQKSGDYSSSILFTFQTERLINEILDIHHQFSFEELTGKILQQPGISSYEGSGIHLPYELAFEMDFLDELGRPV